MPLNQENDSPLSDEDLRQAGKDIQSAILDHRIFLPTKDAPFRRVSVREAFLAAAQSPAGRDNPSARALRHAGMLRVESKAGPLLFVSGTIDVRVAVAETPWAGETYLLDLLAHAPGAEFSRRQPVDTRPQINKRPRDGVFLKITQPGAARASSCASPIGSKDGTHDHLARQTLLSMLVSFSVEEHRESGKAVLPLKWTVHEVFLAAKKSNPKAHDNEYGKVLRRHGMMRIDRADGPRLFVSNSEDLKNDLRGTPWGAGQNIVDALARLEGAQRTTKRPVDTRQRVGLTKLSGVYIPMPADDEPQRSAQQQAEDVRVDF